MAYKTSIDGSPDTSIHGDDHHVGGIGLVQMLGMGLLAFTVLMILMSIALSFFVNLGE